MRTIIRTVGIPAAVALAMVATGCQQAPTPAPPVTDTPAAAASAAPAPAAEPAPAAAATSPGTWPASLPAFGDGFPNPGDPCRRVGESPATANFLDHTASLVGCLSAADATALGGRVVATVDGVTLVSVPTGATGAAPPEPQP